MPSAREPQPPQDPPQPARKTILGVDQSDQKSLIRASAFALLPALAALLVALLLTVLPDLVGPQDWAMDLASLSRSTLFRAIIVGIGAVCISMAIIYMAFAIKTLQDTANRHDAERDNPRS